MSTGASFWRIAGLSYLQYVNKASACVRAGLKEPMKTKADARGRVGYITRDWANGTRGEPRMSFSMICAA
jgi:F-type H+-transporting ATPase subunit epsilon